MPTTVPALPLFTATALSSSTVTTTTTTLANSGNWQQGSLQGNAAAEPLAAWLLQALAGRSITTPAQSERILISQGIPTIPKPLLQKIRRWEFIELRELLPAGSTADASPAMGGAAARVPILPGFELVRQRRRQITNIIEWTQAFLVYMAALVSEDPSATLELIAYGLTIIKASQHYDGLHWRSYDTHYRINAAAAGNRKWSRLDTDLYTRFFTGRARPTSPCPSCDSLGHAEPDCPRRQGPSRLAGLRRVSQQHIPHPPPAKRRQWPSEGHALSA